MPVPVFTTGEVLTAANMNQVGLWLVKSQTIGSGVSSVTVTNCFSSDYDNYKIMIYTNSQGGGGSLLLQLNNATTNTYYTVGNYWGWAVAAPINYASAVVNYFVCSANGSTGQTTGLEIELFNPFLAQPTYMASTASTGGGSSMFNGVGGALSSNTGFTLSHPVSISGGTIRVYGYRN